MDWGEEALLDTIANLKNRGIAVIGGGRNLEEARSPAIITREGIRVAFLAYCSILNTGYQAGPDKAGVAPLRARTYYEPVEYQPGIPPRVVTVPYEEDVKGMVEDITKAKQKADAVIVSMHWGVHYIARMIADYQPIMAKAAFDAGADLILGHHAHVPKAIEVQNGKVCFYSLSNFIMSDYSGIKPGLKEKMKRYGVTPDLEEYPNFPAGKDSHRSLIAKAQISRTGVNKVSFLPVQIDRQLRPEVLSRGDERFDEAVNFMEWVSEDHNHKFRVEADEVVVEG
jgi:poly-gamma-glutamate synthesis protein (capsule biosynthesis protein)